MIKVIHAKNTSDYDIIDGRSCIEYWEKFKAGRDSSICRATRQEETQEDKIVGGHVIGIVNKTPHVYILPILNSVNVSEDPLTFDVDENDLVRVPSQDEQEILKDCENVSRISRLKIDSAKEFYFPKK